MASFPQNAHGSFTSAQASLVVSFSSGISAGSIIVAAGVFQDNATGVTLSDGHGDTPTVVVALTDETGVPGRVFCQAFLTPTTGAISITATYSGATPTYGDLYIWEVAGLTSPAVDKAVLANGSGTAASSGSTGTLSASVEAAIVYGATATGYSAIGSGWTSDGISAGTTDIAGHQVVSTNAALTGTGTLSSSGAWAMLCATFMSTAAAPTYGYLKPKFRPLLRR